MQVRVDYPLQNMSSSSKEAAQKVISRIKAGGGTNLSGGLFKGIDQHQQGVAAEGAPAEQASASEGSLGLNSKHSTLFRVCVQAAVIGNGIAMVWVQPCNAVNTMTAFMGSYVACN